MAYRVGLDKIDVSDDIVLDADGDNITFKAGSDDTLGLDFSQSGSGNWSFGPTTSNKDLSFKVNVAGSPTNAMILKGSNGYLGIGVSDPDAHLEVAGMVHISGEQGSAPSQPSNGDGGYLYTKADGKVYWRSNELSETDLTAAGGSGADVGSANTFTEAQVISKDQDSEFVALVLKNESDVNDDTGFVSLRFDLEDTGGNAVDSAKIAVKKEQAFTATASTQDSSMVLSTSLNGTLTEHATLTSAGNLGVGVTDPDSKLEVLSTGTQAKFSYDTDSFATVTVADASHTTVATGESGNLILDAAGDITLDSASSQVIVLNATTSSATQGGKIRLTSNDGAAMASGHRLGVLEFAGAEDASSNIIVGARIEALCDSGWSATENGTDLLFYTTDGNASQSEQMRILADGKVGIGVADPDSKLEVLSTSTQAKFSYDADSSATVTVADASHTTIATGESGNLILSPAGQVEVSDNLSLKSDAAVLKFGASEEITLTHVANTGLTLASSIASTPVLEIQNTHDGNTAGILKFNNTRGGSDAVDGDDLGSIQFWGNDDGTPSVQQYAGILAEVADASSGAEGGKLSLQVAENDGTVTTGLLLQDGDANGEIDVTIGAGTDSLTTVAGDLFVTGIPRLETQTVTAGSSDSTTITPTAGVVFLNLAAGLAQTGGMSATNMHNLTMSTSGATDGDVVHLIVTTVNSSVTAAFIDETGGDGNVLSGASSLKFPAFPAGGEHLGQGMTLVYVGSASKWAIVGNRKDVQYGGV